MKKDNYSEEVLGEYVLRQSINIYASSISNTKKHEPILNSIELFFAVGIMAAGISLILNDMSGMTLKQLYYYENKFKLNKSEVYSLFNSNLDYFHKYMQKSKR